MAFKDKPARTEVVIIGAGGSGAAAAKVLCEAGVKVVARHEPRRLADQL